MSPKVKYQIFISSTYEDLKDAREQLIKCVLEMGHIPVGMEMFSAANEEQWKVIQKQIDDCDYFTVIIAHRYGSMDRNVSYTEKEYDYALQKGIPILGFILEDSVTWDYKLVEDDEIKKEKLVYFKAKIKSKMVSFWKNIDDLYGKAAIAINKAINTYERPGYIRTSELAGKEVFNEVARLSSENSTLRSKLEESIKLIENNKFNEENELINVLKNSEKRVPTKSSSAFSWEYFDLSLLDIFESISKYLIVESDEVQLRGAIGLTASGKTHYKIVANNRFAEWMADLYALELIEPSSKKHKIDDLKKYWTLTEKGREIINKLKKLTLLSGKSAEDKDDIKDEE